MAFTATLNFIDRGDGTLKSETTESVLSLLKREDFETGTLASKTWIENQSGNLNYSAIVSSGGGYALRHNLHNSRGSNDPISDKPCSGLYTHIFRADQFHTAAANPAVSLDMKFKLDQCLWDTNVNDVYPYIAGKLFICDKTVDSLAMYLSLTSTTTMTFTSGNDGSGIWSPDPAVGWCSRAYGWRNVNATARGNISFSTPTGVFKSDGTARNLRMEVRYNPGAIGYHKARFRINDVVLHDSTAVNTDADGWFNLPPEFELKGFRFYAADLDVNDALDVGTNPGTYSGHAAGLEVLEYSLYSGVLE